MRFLQCCLILPAVCCLFSGAAPGAVITFENLPGETAITNQYSGLTFTNAITLESGISLNEFEFPPRSGRIVASDIGGPLSISFQSAVFGFSGFFTYSTQLTVAGYDSSNQLLASATSLYSSNLALSGVNGSSPNEVISITSPVPLARVTITGFGGGESFAMDDIEAVAIPEPAEILPAAVSLLCLAVLRSLRRRA